MLVELSDWQAEDLAGVLRDWQRGSVYPSHHGVVAQSIEEILMQLPSSCACALHAS